MAVVTGLLPAPRLDGIVRLVPAQAAGPPTPADISVTQTVDNGNPGVGSSVTFTITARNKGPGDATGVKVTDQLPAGLSVPARHASAGSYDPKTGVWAIGALARGAAATLQLTATVTQTGPLVNTATRTAEDQPDPTSADDSASVQILGQSADIAVTNNVDEARPNVGDQVIFTVTATNNGPTDATGVKVTDLLPVGLLYADDNPSQGNYDAVTGLWTVGALPTGSSASLELSAQVERPGRQVDTASGAVADQFNPSANVSVPVTINGESADLSVVEVVDNVKPSLGANVKLTITASNAGPSDATGVEVSARVPPGLTLLSSSSESPYDPATGVWKLGSLANGTSANLTIVAKVTQPGPILASAGKIAEDQTDPVGTNDFGTVAFAGQLADVAVALAVDDPNPSVGAPVTLTVKAANKGPSDATGVVISSVLPAGMSLLSAAPTDGVYDPNSGTWRIGALGNGSSATLSLRAVLTRALPQTLTARLAGLDQAGPAQADESASVALTGQQADVAVRETVDRSAVRVGERVTFTASATNQGPSDATALLVTATLPPGLKLAAARASAGTYDADTGGWVIGRLAAGATVTLTLQATVVGAGPLVSVVRKAAQGQADPTVDDDTAAATVIGEAADVAVAMKVDSAKPNLGSTVTFTITASNNGPQAATGVTVRDLLPAGLTLISADPAAGDYSPATGDWHVAALAPGASATLTVRATVGRPGPIVNEARKTAEDQADPVTANDSAAVTVIGQAAHIAVSSSVDDLRPGVGGTVTITVSATNRGPADASGVKLAVTIPAGLSYLSSSASTGHYDAVAGVWTLGDLATGASASLLIWAGVSSFGPLVATARTVAQDQPDPAGTGSPDQFASVSLAGQLAHVALATAVDRPRPSVGGQVTIVVTATNRGPSDATGIEVSNQLPPGLTPLSASASTGTWRAASTMWTIPHLPGGATATLTLKARVMRPGPLISVARKVHQDQPDPSPVDASAEATVVGQQADVTLTQAVDVARPGAGQRVTFTITAFNSGPSDATAVQVVDALPAGLRYVSSVATAGGYDPRVGTWSIDSLMAGGKATLSIMATVARAGPVTNTARKSAQGEFDPTSSDDFASSTVTAQAASVEVSQRVDDPTPNVGAPVMLTVAAVNRGPDGASGVRLQEMLPEGLAYTSSRASQGTYDPTTGIWAVGSLEPGLSATLELHATVVQAGNLTVTALRTALDQFDSGTERTSAQVSLSGQSAAVQVASAVDDPEPSVGAIATFTVTATNHGPSDATGVTIADPMPPGLELVSASPVGAYDANAGTWQPGRLPSGTSSTLTLKARVTRPGLIMTTARRVHQDQAAPAGSQIAASASLTGRQADIALGMSVDRSRVNIGEQATFTVTASNAGPSDATALTVVDRLPTGLTLAAATASSGTYSPATGIWSVGPLARGAHAALTLETRVDAPGLITNRAVRAASDPTDPTPADDATSEVVIGQAADIGLTMTADSPQPRMGGRATFTITVTNHGPSDARKVDVVDQLPAGLAFLSSQTSQGDYDPGTGVWSVGSLGGGATATLRMSTTVTQAGPLVNQARSSSAGPPDPDPGNDSAVVRLAGQAADVSVAVVADRARLPVGGTVRLTVTATNHGPDAASGVRLAGRLPAGLTVISATASAGTFDPASTVWNLGPLAPGSSATLALTARASRAAAFEVAFSKVGEEQPDPTSLDDSSAAVVTGQLADMALSETVDNPRPGVGRNVTLTVTAANSGPDEATEVVVAPVLSAGLELVSTVASSGSYDRATGEWRLDSLAPATKATLALTATVARAGPLSGSAAIRAEDQADPTPADDSAVVSLAGQAADIAVSQIVDNPRPNVGDRVAFTVTVRNLGPSASSGVVVTDLLSPALVYAGHATSQGTFTPASGAWTVGTLAAGSSATMRLMAKESAPGALISTARRTASDAADPNPANDVAAVTINGQQADVGVAVEASSAGVPVGGRVTLRVSASNRGPSDATGVRVTDQLPTGLSYVSASSSAGAYDPLSGVWDVGGLPMGGTATLQITAMVGRAGNITDGATRSHSDQPDPNGANDSASATVAGESADVAVAIAADNGHPNVGAPVTLTVTTVNYGPSQSTGLKVGNQLPAGLALVSASASAGAYDPGSRIWSLPSLADGGSATLHLSTTVTHSGALVAVARKVAEDQADPTAGDDSAAVTVTGQAADIALSQTVDNPTPNLNGRAVIALTVTDMGPSDATGVKVSDLLPPGLDYVSSRASQGSYNRSGGVWSVGALPAGGTASLQLGVTVTQAEPLTNEAAASADQADPRPANNTSSVRISARLASVSLTRTVDNPQPRLGSTVTFTVTAFNAGPEDATGVRVTNALPVGLTLVSVRASQGAYDAAGGIWVVGNLGNGATATLTVQAWMDLPGPFISTSRESQDQPNLHPNPIATVSVRAP